MALPRTEIERALVHLESELRRLEAEYNLYFIGRLPRPPWETRKHVDGLVKRLDRTHIQNTAERFRFSTLQARYVKFCELWERALRAKEEGRSLSGRVRAAAPPPEMPSAAVPPHEPVRAAKTKRDDETVHVASLRDPSAEPDKVQALYARVSEARRTSGEPELPYERFQALVEHQLRKHSQGGEVAFKVAVKDGKVNLTARAIKPKE
jgi:hypothetical protein